MGNRCGGVIMNHAARILVVDGDLARRRDVADLLRQEGYDVSEAASGTEALRLAWEKRPEVVLLDVVLPDVSGTSVSRQIREDPALASRSEVLLVADRTDSDDQTTGIKSDAAGFTARPVARSELLAQVRGLVRLKQTEIALRERVKELNCLYSLSSLTQRPGISLPELMQGAVELLPPAWQYPEVTCARIVLASQEYRSANFQEATWWQASDIVVHGQRAGLVEVSYLEERPASDEGPFLKEERALLDTVAKRLGQFVAQAQAEEALRSTTERYTRLFKASRDALFVIDVRGRLLDANPAATALTGYSAQELRQFTMDDLLIPAGQSSLVEKQPAWREGRPQELSLRHKDGHAVPVELIISPVGEQDPQDLVLGAARETSERKQAEQVLRRSEGKFRGVVEHSENGIALTDEQGKVIEWNRAMERITGLAAAEVVGRPMWNVQHRLELPEQRTPERSRDIQAAMVELLGTGQVPWLGQPLTREYLHPSGERRFIEGTVFSIPTEQGFMIGSISRDVTGRRQMETERERQRQRAEELSRTLAHERDMLRVVIENTSAHLAYLDPQFNFVWVNTTYARGSGYRQEELIGLNHFDLFPHPENQAIFERVRDTGQPVEFLAKPFDFPDQPERGTTYWDWTLVPMRDEEGQVRGLVLSLLEVTERERSRATLEQYAARLHFKHEIAQAILEARSLEEIAAATLDHVRRLVPCRRTSLAVLGPRAGEALLIAVRADQQTTMPQGTYIPLEQVWFLEEIQQGRVYLVDDLQSLTGPSPALQALWEEGVRSYLSIPLLVEGNLVGALNLGTASPSDLTAERLSAIQGLASTLAVAVHQAGLRRQLEEALRQVRQDYAALVDSIDGIVWEAEAQTFRFHFVSRQAERLLGYPVERWLAEATFWQDHLHPEDREWAPAFCARATEEKRDHEFEYRMITADGRIVWLRDIVTVVVENDRPSKLRGVMVDITQQKAMQEALLRSEKLAAMGRLTAVLAHEINNPLQSIVGSLGLAREALDEGKAVDRYLEVAREEVQRLSRITEQMRDLYRPTMGEKEPTELNELVERVVFLNLEMCRGQRIELSWEPAADLPWLPVVPDQIRQVILNLLLNAVEAMPDGGHLSVSTTLTDEPAGVGIRITDSGPGIPPEVQKRLFEPFYSTKPRGVGLGLFVSYNIVQQHGGTIDFHNPEGGGTTFTVWLPLDSADV